jgi:hypothetical protein
MLGVAPGPVSAISYGASIDIPSTDAAASENGASRRLKIFSIIATVGVDSGQAVPAAAPLARVTRSRNNERRRRNISFTTSFPASFTNLR